MIRRRVFVRALAGMTLLWLAGAADSLPWRACGADEPTGLEFFESRIRPVLIERCYACHNSNDRTEGDLSVDSRASIRAGGGRGPAVVPGRPDESLLLSAIRHADSDLRMPEDAAKLSAETIADFEQWIVAGAIDPRDAPPSPDALERLTAWDSVRQRRQSWWSYRPLTDPPIPATSKNDHHPVDRFLAARLADVDLNFAEPADRRTLLRRLTFALHGLPPTREQIEAFVNDDSPQAVEKLIDGLLASMRFGEHWARHWMDWFRYAESHGSEGDPAIPYAWRYRDYLIRALNADIPYDQLVREHLAGDLLDEPRINAELGINESACGIGHFRMVQHGYAPTDALDEQVRFTENQIDVITKAFLAQTVSCARCHDHKFDPISQADFYALYGILASCRPALVTVDSRATHDQHRTQLKTLKRELRLKFSQVWLDEIDRLPARLTADSGVWRDRLVAIGDQPADPLFAWSQLGGLSGQAFLDRWQSILAQWNALNDAFEQQHASTYAIDWNPIGETYDRWSPHGLGLPNTPAPAGGFHVASSSDRVIDDIFPAGVFTHGLSTQFNGYLTSPRFKITTDWLSVRVAGEASRVRYVVQNYPRSDGAIYGAKEIGQKSLGWVHFDTSYWKGDWAYLELATNGDLPVRPADPATRSWFGVTGAVASLSKAERPTDVFGPDNVAPLNAWMDNASPTSTESLASLYAKILREAISAWRDQQMTDEQASFLAYFVRYDLLPNSRDVRPDIARLVDQYRLLESTIPPPTRAPGIVEGDSFDQPLFARGNHQQPTEDVRRRFLECIDGRPFETLGSGRLELAAAMMAPDNPLTSRVLVNRVWHHLFGRGLVATPDNFGHMGALPSHPQLLDYLAVRFHSEGSSIKQLIRFIVGTQAFQQSSSTSRHAAQVDPTNVWLSHFPIRRLSAEAIRDALIANSGEMDSTMYGPSVRGDALRRSVYVTVLRNDLDPFLAAFDAPQPHSTRGRRDVTNVPAQSLFMLNDRQVIDLAQRFARRIERDASLTSDAERVSQMYVLALGRNPTSNEQSECLAYLDQCAVNERLDQVRDEPDQDDIPRLTNRWHNLAHAIFNLKEFIYVK